MISMVVIELSAVQVHGWNMRYLCRILSVPSARSSVINECIVLICRPLLEGIPGHPPRGLLHGAVLLSGRATGTEGEPL